MEQVLLVAGKSIVSQTETSQTEKHLEVVKDICKLSDKQRKRGRPKGTRNPTSIQSEVDHKTNQIAKVLVKIEAHQDEIKRLESKADAYQADIQLLST